MYESFFDSIFLIESRQSNNKKFGTGFIVHQDEQFTYLLTCAHIVDDVGIDDVEVDGKSATVIAMGASNDIDLAVLAFHRSSIISKIELLAVGNTEDLITVIGYHDYGQHRLLKPIHGHLGDQGRLKKPKSKGVGIRVWDLIMDGDDYLQLGYSGSPVVDKNSNRVFGVVSHRRGKGDKGLAISIEALSEIWELIMVMVPGLMLLEAGLEEIEMDRPQRDMNDPSSIERLQKQIATYQKAWDDLQDKRMLLLQDRANAASRRGIDQLTNDISLIEVQQKDIETHLNALEARLGDS